jgi:hypothetical protein
MPKLPHALLFLLLLAIAAISTLAQSPVPPPQPGPENRQLAIFLGTWKDEAVFQPSPISPGGKMNLTQTCDWFSGGFSLVCRSDSTGYLGDIKTLSIITYDAEARHYTLFELNSFGLAETSMGSYNAGVWTFTREFKSAGKTLKIRATIKLPTSNSALMTSELSVDGGPWSSFMELKGNRTKPSANVLYRAPVQQWPEKKISSRNAEMVLQSLPCGCDENGIQGSEMTRR